MERRPRKKARQEPSPEQVESFFDRTAANMLAHGWALTGVFGAPDLAPFTYSCGFTETLGVPEVVVVGLSYENAGRIINEVGAALKARPAELRGELLTGRPERLMKEPFAPGFRNLGSARDDDRHFGVTKQVLGRDDFEVVQILIPDLQNLLPGEPGCDPQYEVFQSWPPEREAR